MERLHNGGCSMRIAACLMALALAGCASEPQRTAQTTTAQEPITMRGDGAIVQCRTEEVTGSRLQTKKLCLTKEEWAARERAARESFGETQNKPQINRGGDK